VAAEKYALIVEDTADIAGIMQLTLDSLNIMNQHAPNGFLALEMLESRLPDIMLLDIGMPGMNGWEVLEAVKIRWPDADFPVIVLTAFSDPANRLIGKLQAHVFRYLTKPFDVEELSRVVREALHMV
jgi:two-component system nitrogen regulation response regulator GlnG